MIQFTTEQLQGIVSPDKERLIYEIEAKISHYGSLSSGVSFWPITDMVAFSYWMFLEDKRIDYHNSQGNHIATFKLKSWKK